MVLIIMESYNINAGRPVYTADGEIGLEYKGKGNVYDTISLAAIAKQAEQVLNHKKKPQ